MKFLLLGLTLLSLLPITSIAAANTSALDIPITTQDGNTTTLNALRKNGPLYVKIWASWCSGCMQQMPHFKHIHKQYKNTLTTVGINLWLNETPEAMDEVIRSKQLSMPTLIDTNGELAQAFGLIATPMHILIDQQGRVVHTGHEASAELDDKIALISEGKLPQRTSENTASDKDNNPIEIKAKGRIGVLYTSTWCDWYLKDTRPTMAANCAAAQNFINSQKKDSPESQWLVVTSRLWTGEKELNQYRERYNTDISLVIDTSNRSFIDNNIRNFPTLVIFDDGKEVMREEVFSDAKTVKEKLIKL